MRLENLTRGFLSKGADETADLFNYVEEKIKEFLAKSDELQDEVTAGLLTLKPILSLPPPPQTYFRS